MSLTGIFYDSSLIDPQKIATLATDHMAKHPPGKTYKVAQPLREKAEDPWITIDATYPEQMYERYRLLLIRASWHIDRLEGDDVAAAEIELRDTVADYLLYRYPDYFTKNDNVIDCHLTGFSVDLGPEGADPMMAVGMMVSEDMVMMLPGIDTYDEICYVLKSGALITPNGWSLRSQFNDLEPEERPSPEWWEWKEDRDISRGAAKLDKTAEEIHDDIPYYKKKFAHSVEKYFPVLKPGTFAWRRNWMPTIDPRLSRHPDGGWPDEPPLTNDAWHIFYKIRSEHQTFTKLPESGAVVFGLKTYMWPIAEVLKDTEFTKALVEAHDNLPPEMYDYRKYTLPSFGEMLKAHLAGEPMRSPNHPKEKQSDKPSGPKTP